MEARQIYVFHLVEVTCFNSQIVLRDAEESESLDSETKVTGDFLRLILVAMSLALFFLNYSKNRTSLDA